MPPNGIRHFLRAAVVVRILHAFPLERKAKSGAPIFCCGKEMEVLQPNTSEGAGEKHLPVVTRRGDTVHVNVGSAAHPMTAEHSIQWVYLQTDRGGQRKCLRPDQPPEVDFALTHETPTAAYAYCNLHGLWKTELSD